jgi:hypothetical protein
MSRESEARGFDATAISGISKKAQEAVQGVFEAMTAWQSETAKVGEKNSKQVLDKMVTAAAALGWPEQIVEAARAQIQSVGEMQTKTMEHIRRAWEEQLKSPNPATASPEAILSKLQAMPNIGAAGSLPNADALRAAAAAPMALWMEFGKQWQQLWLETLDRMNKANRG